MKKSCGNCRYGNNCPYGGDEIFCLKGYEINNITELCSIFDNIEIRDFIFGNLERSKSSYCKDYEPVNHDDFFTYSD